MQTNIAIIGGGIGGLYTAFKLDQLGIHDGTIYNADERLGGKIHSNVYTDQFGKKLFCEWGAMRFEWGCQPYLEELIDELGIDLIDFPPFCGDRGWELDLIEKICADIWRHFFDFHHIIVHENIWDYLYRDENYTRYFAQLGDAAWLPFQHALTRPQEVYLLEWLGDINPAWKVELEKAASSVRAFLGIEFNVLHWMSRWTKVMMANDQIKTCKNGNESIIDELVRRLPQQHIQLNKQLVRLLYDAAATDFPYTLEFKNGEVHRACRVVMALPPRQLLQLNADYPAEVRELLASLHGFELGRVFVRIKNPWWNADSFFAMQNENADALKAREVYYYTLSDDEGVIMIYFGRHFMQHWRQFHTDEQIVHELARLLTIDKKRIIDVRYKLWDGQSHVYAFQYLANGYAPHDVMQHLSRLNNDTMAILGDSFSFDAGFIEGVLTSCHYYLNTLHKQFESSETLESVA